MSQAVYDYDYDAKSLRDYLLILKRRKFHLALPAVVVAAVALMIVFALPARYQSQATILIEDQEVPREFVTSTITTFAAQQVQVISQRVLTTERIASIAEKYGLYVDPQSGTRPPATQMAAAFRQSMTVDLVSADVIDPRSGQARQATIAFTLAFEHGDAGVAQRVTNELVTLFMDENLRTRTERAASTGAFLAAEAEGLNQELLEIERQLAEFKTRNEGALPELYDFNLGVLDRTTQEMLAIDTRLKEIAQRKLELGADLALIAPQLPVVTQGGQAIPGEQERLRMLRAEFRQKSAVYKPNHPDLVRLTREISELEAQLGVSESPAEIAAALEERRRELADLRLRYQDDSVQVIAALRQVQDLERRLEVGAEATPSAVAAAPADNPAYILLDTQLKAASVEENGLIAKRTQLEARKRELEGLLSRAPALEQEYKALLRDYETAQVKYRDIRSKQREAELAESLEVERKGERFVLVEPPTLPIAPSSPNRPALLALGLMAAIGAGVGTVVLLEMANSAVYGEKRLAQLTGAPPFAVVAYIENSDDRERQAKVLKRLVYGAAAGVVVLVIYAHFFIKPLDVAWFMLLGRLGW